MKKILVAVMGAACAALSSFATDYYVSTNGVDAAGRGTADAPFASITYAIKSATKSGDIVYVAEGTYTNGTVTIPVGVGVVATGARARTVIDGGYDSSAEEKSGVRGAYLSGSGSYIKGFTIRNCYNNGYGGGVYVNAGSAAIQCAFYNCYSVGRGGAGSGSGSYIGCYFDSTNTDTQSPDTTKSVWSPGAIVNCVFKGQGYFGNDSKILNCTFAKGARIRNNASGTANIRVYNSLVEYYQYTIVPTNSVFVYNAANEGAVQVDNRSQFNIKDKTTAAIDGAYAPMNTATLLLGKGDKALYDELFPAAWAAYKNVDFNLQPRFTTGDAMDIGANQRILNETGIWYVDAETGDDGNFGTSPNAAKKTIAAGLAMCGSNEKLFVAEGIYEGGFTVPASVGLEATGSRANTIIDGGMDEGKTSGNRAATLNALSYIKGFTITNCYSASNGAINAQGANAAIIGCAFYNCWNAYRGGAGGNGGYWIGCYFHSTVGSTGGNNNSNALWSPAGIFNCVFNSQGSYGYAIPIVNSTFINGARITNNGAALVYNCRVYASQNACYMYNCVCPIAKDGNAVADDDCVFAPSDLSTLAIGSDYTPRASATLMLGKGKQSYYDDSFPASWSAYKDIDYNGRPRVENGDTLDIGACQYDWTQDTTIGFTFTKEAAGEGQVKFTFTRNGLSAKPLVSLTFGGETLNFDENGETGSITVAGSPTDAFPRPTPVYDANVSAWYVDGTNGNDANNGGRATMAFKTITSATAVVQSGHVIKVAEGTYEGGITLTAGIGLEATGARANTVIDGGMDEGKTSGKVCVTLNGDGAYVRGFTIRNGYGSAGGGVRSMSSSYDAAVIQCDFYNCYSCYRGGAGEDVAHWIGCYFDASNGAVNGNAHSHAIWNPMSLVNCVFNSEAQFDSGKSAIVMNCTYVNNARSTSNPPAETLGARGFNTLFMYAQQGRALTNSVSYLGAGDCSFKFVDAATVTYGATALGTAQLNADYSPKGTASLLIGQGSKELYDTYFPANWTAYKGVDYNGRARWTNSGSMDIGACQYDWTQDATIGFTFTKEAAGEGQVKFTFTRNGLSAKPLVSLTFCGETLNFDTAGETGSITVAGSLTDVFPAPTLVYDTNVTVWYVDDANGNNDNNGGRAAIAFKTIAKALAVAKSGHVIKVAEGTYAGGITLTAGIGLEATGARASTIIDGGMDKAQANTNEWTYGVELTGDDAYLKGFTIQNCYSDYCAGARTYADAAVIGCAFYNNYATERGGAAGCCNDGNIGGTWIGCYFDSSNDSRVTPAETRNLYIADRPKPGFVANCVFKGRGFFGNGTTIVNSTFTDGAMLRNNNEKMTNLVVISSAVYQYYSVVVSTNSVFAYSAKDSQMLADDRSVFQPAETRVQLDANYCPKQYTASIYVDRGDAALYNAIFPAKWAVYKDVDFNGNARVDANGKMDIGAGQHTWTKSGSLLIFH